MKYVLGLILIVAAIPAYQYLTEPVCLPRPSLAVMCVAWPRWRT